MSQITNKGKEYALEQLRQRCEANKDKTRKINNNLRAGSPMFYYCGDCGEEIQLAETHLGPASRHCNECAALRELGWLE